MPTRAQAAGSQKSPAASGRPRGRPRRALPGPAPKGGRRRMNRLEQSARAPDAIFRVYDEQEFLGGTLAEEPPEPLVSWPSRRPGVPQLAWVAMVAGALTVAILLAGAALLARRGASVASRATSHAHDGGERASEQLRLTAASGARAHDATAAKRS